MKQFKAFLLAAALLMLTPSAQCAVIYSGLQNIAIPLTLDGVYLNVITGATSSTQPADWNTAPWINPFFGGVYISNDSLLRPAVTGADQVLNLPGGTLIGSASNFVAGESGSTTHIGAAPNQFQLGVPGYLGFTFQPTVGGSAYYGWANVTFNNSGAGSINSYAYDDTGSPIFVPEPSRVLLFFSGLCMMVMRRRRGLFSPVS